MLFFLHQDPLVRIIGGMPGPLHKAPRPILVCTADIVRLTKNFSCSSAGIAASSDGIHWQRGFKEVSGERGAGKDVGEVLGPNKDWWWHDTCHLTVGDVQVRPLITSAGVGMS